MDQKTASNTGGGSNATDDLKKLQEQWNNGQFQQIPNQSTGIGGSFTGLPQTYFPQPHPCPTCGSCPTCGRAPRRVYAYGYPGYYWNY